MLGVARKSAISASIANKHMQNRILNIQLSNIIAKIMYSLETPVKILTKFLSLNKKEKKGKKEVKLEKMADRKLLETKKWHYF